MKHVHTHRQTRHSHTYVCCHIHSFTKWLEGRKLGIFFIIAMYMLSKWTHLKCSINRNKYRYRCTNAFPHWNDDYLLSSVKSVCSKGSTRFINFKTCSLKKETEDESSNC